jgi:hypothetical protein
LLAVLLNGCSGSCENTYTSGPEANPNGDVNVYHFRRDCGGSTDYSTHVALMKKGDAKAKTGNVFVGEPAKPSGGAVGPPWVELRWLSPRKLLVRYDAKARVLTQNTSVSGVAISYEKVAR